MTKSRALVFCALALVALCPFAAAKNPWKNPTNYAGSFNVIVRGYWHGKGVAVVTATTVQITASVSDDEGNTGSLTTDTLPLNQNHFTGGGTVLGIRMTINGRAEPQDQPSNNGNGNGNGKGKKSGDPAVTTNANLQASLTANGHAARVVGTRDGTGS